MTAFVNMLGVQFLPDFFSCNPFPVILTFKYISNGFETYGITWVIFYNLLKVGAISLGLMTSI